MSVLVSGRNRLNVKIIESWKLLMLKLLRVANVEEFIR